MDGETTVAVVHGWSWRSFALGVVGGLAVSLVFDVAFGGSRRVDDDDDEDEQDAGPEGESE